MSIRGGLKKNIFLRNLVLRTRALRKEFSQNPDIVEWIERAVFSLTHHKSLLPLPTAEEEVLINSFRERMERLPVELPTSTTPGPQALWMNYKNELRTKFLNEDPRTFLTWNVIAYTMGASIFRREYKDLERLPFWQKWRTHIASRPLSFQKPYFKFPDTDGTTLHHAYHAAQLLQYFNLAPTDTDLIIDLGGGYGSMCALMHTLGFEGEYILFDSPEFLILQEFYLRLCHQDTSHIHFISDIAQLRKVANGRRGLLIATWSLSETSEKFREEFLSAIHPNAYLIGYQGVVRGTDNNAYFKKLVTNHPELEWLDYPVKYRPYVGNRYLLGKAREN